MALADFRAKFLQISIPTKNRHFGEASPRCLIWRCLETPSVIQDPQVCLLQSFEVKSMGKPMQGLVTMAPLTGIDEVI